MKKKIKKLKDGRAMLNLGCGNKYHQDWNNINFASLTDKLFKKDPNIIYYDLRKGIPFQDECFDVVYHSHFLEHLERQKAIEIISESYRVLKNGGITRIVVPDLEYLAREYFRALTSVRKDKEYQQEYELAVLNLIDQMTREKRGGYLLKFYRDKENYNFLKQKIGIKNLDQYLPDKKAGLNKLFINKIKSYFIKSLQDSGELHKWMYDSYSLSKILIEHSFKSPTVFNFQASQIKNWNKFGLDINKDGTPYKTESLFIESVKIKN
jgi:predicted SAM-dependent methyltransferase